MEGDEEISEEEEYHQRLLLRKRNIQILRSLQIVIGVLTLLIGIMGVTIVDEHAGKFLFVGIFSGFLMIKAALASFLILHEHSGRVFKGWKEGIIRAERYEAFCVAVSWILGLLTTVSMIVIDIVVLLTMHGLNVTIIAILEMVLGYAMLLIVFISVRYSSLKFNRSLKKEPVQA